MRMVQGTGRGRSSLVGAMVWGRNDRLVRVSVASSAADKTYAVEDAFELEMSTRVLSLDESAQWLMMIAENEGVDHPHLSRAAMSRSLLGLAFVDEWCITVRKKKPSQLLLLHEMAHLVCANQGHGREFRTQVVTYLRRYISLTHALRLHELFVGAGLTIEPFASTK